MNRCHCHLVGNAALAAPSYELRPFAPHENAILRAARRRRRRLLLLMLPAEVAIWRAFRTYFAT